MLTTDLSFYRFHWDSEERGCVGHITQARLNFNPFGNSLPRQGDETGNALSYSNQVLLRTTNGLNNSSLG